MHKTHNTEVDMGECKADRIEFTVANGIIRMHRWDGDKYLSDSSGFPREHSMQMLDAFLTRNGFPPEPVNA